MIELNFIGSDPDDSRLGEAVPRPAGLILEKLVSDRSGSRGDRDLLAVLGLLIVSGADDLDELLRVYRTLPAELRYHVRANLSVLSLLEPVAGMPNPEPHRARLAALLASFEAVEGALI